MKNNFDGRTTLFPRSQRQRALGKGKQQDAAKLAESRAWFEHLKRVANGRKQSRS